MPMIQPLLCSFSHCEDLTAHSVTEAINHELRAISNWLSVNKLALNASKSKLVFFHTYQKIMSGDENPKLIMNDVVIERVMEFNFLGWTIGSVDYAQDR